MFKYRLFYLCCEMLFYKDVKIAIRNCYQVILIFLEDVVAGGKRSFVGIRKAIRESGYLTSKLKTRTQTSFHNIFLMGRKTFVAVQTRVY